MKTAVIFGVTGQDGSYLAELLLGKGYRVIGVSRRTSTPNEGRIRHLGANPHFEVVRGDVTDPLCVYRCLSRAGQAWLDDDDRDGLPIEVYNLAAQSHVGDSFVEPHHTTQATYLGCLNILEAIRSNGFFRDYVRFYQASSSEMFGSAYSTRHLLKPGAEPFDSKQMKCRFEDFEEIRYQDEQTLMLPCSPYAIAKLAAHHLCRVYRESYDIHASSGILFNHESERRGETFVTRKITKYIARWVYAKRHEEPIEPLKLGNLQACRDWGHAQDYVRAMWLMLQQEKPDDFVICTGQTHTVEDFLLRAFAAAGLKAEKVENLPVEIDPNLYRPCEVPYLRGDASKAKSKLGWQPEIDFDQLVKRMVYADIAGMWGDEYAERFDCGRAA